MLFLELMKKGGPLMWIILICSLLALFIFLIKVFQFHRDEIGVRELLRGLFNVLKRDGLVEALTLCDNTPGPVARLLGAGILAYQRGDENIRAAIDEAALEELPKLERHIRMLGTLCYIMPLLGLLGTVLGMLGVFESISATGNFTTEAVSQPVWQALLTTAAGLTITIPCHVGYNYLVGRVESMTLDMEKAALELASFFERSRQNSSGQKK
ncbi:MAG: MotA/TolQ/ExbB proton channel family protein [Lentisphaerae bacterium]|nr:MotA/TolQ/ExbB proton channel family protein [Lentisphaerota bacterium]